MKRRTTCVFVACQSVFFCKPSYLLHVSRFCAANLRISRMSVVVALYTFVFIACQSALLCKPSYFSHASRSCAANLRMSRMSLVSALQTFVFFACQSSLLCAPSYFSCQSVLLCKPSYFSHVRRFSISVGFRHGLDCTSLHIFLLISIHKK